NAGVALGIQNGRNGGVGGVNSRRVTPQVEVVVEPEVSELALRVGLRPAEQIIRALNRDEERVGRDAVGVLGGSRAPGSESGGGGLCEVFTDVRAGACGEDVVIVAVEASDVTDDLKAQAAVDDDNVVVKVDVVAVVFQFNGAAHIVINGIIDELGAD